ncbi:(2,3-dihydroxybenzoyl)adenylate synthase [Moraxella marmotae]|uniref:(2,3-dihydroxybenzoyl)adenylate synthase n=1 Tax=Moraxella marmotae TaxID=3344520 RepID=UPI0035F33291
MSQNNILFHKWPDNEACLYREEGYWIDKPLTDLLLKTHDFDKNRTAIICNNRHFSYQQLDELSTNLAYNLASMGLTKGDIALVQLPNVAEFYITFFALLKIGVAPLNAIYSHKQHELASFIEIINPKILITDNHHPVFKDENFLQNLAPCNLLPPLILQLNAKCQTRNLEHWIFNTPSAENTKTFTISTTKAEEVAFFQLSGGSTGTPKIIPRTHNDYYYSVRASAELCRLTSDSVFLCVLPAAHNFTLSSPGALGVFYAGGCVVMTQNPEPTHCFQLIEQHRVSIVSLVPSLATAWMSAVTGIEEKIKSLQLIQVGGAYLPEIVARKIPKVFNCKLQQVFGMAEGLVNYTRLDDSDEIVATTQGRPLSNHDLIKIVDENGDKLPKGEVGALLTKGPYTFQGYYKAELHNKKIFDDDGFYRTGDLVRLTPDGYIQVVGRIKDQINKSGEKIAAEEIENLLLQHTAIQDVAVVSITNDNLEEKTCAVLVPKQETLSLFAIRKHLMQIGIADYKLPDFIYLLDCIPLTAIGKPDKKTLRTLVQKTLFNH